MEFDELSVSLASSDQNLIIGLPKKDLKLIERFLSNQILELLRNKGNFVVF